MPCYDPRSGDDEKHAREGMAAACTLIKWVLSEGYVLEDLPPEVAAWHFTHVARDATPATAPVLDMTHEQATRTFPRCTCGTVVPCPIAGHS